MKRISLVALCLLFASGVVSDAVGGKIAVGGSLGANIPVAQDDASASSLFGFGVRMKLTRTLGIEPFFTKLNQGDTSVDVWDQEMSREGARIACFGLNVLFGSMSADVGTHFHVAGGIGSYTMSQRGIPDETRFGYNLGPGIEFGLGRISIEISSAFHVITLEGGGSRKNIAISGGVNYYFGIGEAY